MTPDDTRPLSPAAAPAHDTEEKPRRRRRRRRGHASKPGTAPGTLRVPADAAETHLEVAGYGPEAMELIEPATLDDLDRLQREYPNIWINIEGLSDLDLIRTIGTRFKLHDLALEDVFNPLHRPKAEEYDDHHFIIARMPTPGDFPHTEQVAMFVGDTFVICFQERPGDCFDPIRTRLRDPRSRMRRNKPDFLAYALLDSVIDSYFPVLERIGDDLEILEEQALARSDPGIMTHIHGVKRDVIELRRAIWPHREMINALLRDESRFFADSTRLYFRDCYDHVAQLMDVIEIDREYVSDLYEVHLSRVNLRMNEIMKVLTIIATIFIPLSFVASLYGMNFDPDVSPWNMPELRWFYGYPFVLGLMTLIGGGLLYYIYRLGWLRPSDGQGRRSRRKRR